MKEYTKIALNDGELMSLVGKTIVDTFNTQKYLVVSCAYDGCENYITTIQGDGIHHHTSSDLLSQHYWRLGAPDGVPLWHTPTLVKWCGGTLHHIPICKLLKNKFRYYEIGVYEEDVSFIGYDGLNEAFKSKETLYIDERFGDAVPVRITSTSYEPIHRIISMEMCPVE